MELPENCPFFLRLDPSAGSYRLNGAFMKSFYMNAQKNELFVSVLEISQSHVNFITVSKCFTSFKINL